MGLVESWNNFSNRVGLLVGGGTQIAQNNSLIMDKIVGGMCNLAEKYPDKFTSSAYTRGWLSGACSDAGVGGFPPLPPPGFEGGQCEGVAYNVIVETTTINIGSCELVGNNQTAYVMTGPLADIFVQVLIPAQLTSDCFKDQDEPVDQVEYYMGTGDGNVRVHGGVFLYSNSESTPPLSSATVISVERVDGLPDDCGNREPVYPPSGDIDINDTSITIAFAGGQSETYNYEGGDTFGDEFNFTSSSSSTTDNSTTINLSGVGVSIFGSGTGGQQPPGSTAPPPENTEENTFKPEDFDVEEDEVEEEEKAMDEERLAWVIVKVTVDPEKRHVILFNSPDIRHMFAGYFCWTIDDGGIKGHLPWQYITKEENAYKAPIGVTGYRAYTINNAKITTKVFKTKVEG